MDIWPELRALQIPDDFTVTRTLRSKFLEACDQGTPNTQDAVFAALGSMVESVALLEGRVIAAENRIRAMDGKLPSDGPAEGGWFW